jgi:hypothetical protein
MSFAQYVSAYLAVVNCIKITGEIDALLCYWKVSRLGQKRNAGL